MALSAGAATIHADMTMPDTNSPLRILQVLEPSGGGSGRHFVDLCAGLKARGHAVTAVYSPVRAEERFVGELKALDLRKVIALPMLRAVGPADASAWQALAQVVLAEGPFDIIHGHSSKAGALTRIRLPGPHVPRIYTPHAFRTMDPTLGAKGRLLFGKVESLLGRFFTDRLICVSQSEYEHALTLGIPAELLRVVVNGVGDMPQGNGSAIRGRLGLPDEAIVFGFVGRLSAQKAPERLIAAFTKLAANVPSARLLMVGHGELEQAIRLQLETANLADRVTITADITGAEVMQALDVLVMPSRYEAMSYVMLEAAASGLPIIVTDVGGARNVVTPDENGIIVANNDAPSSLAKAMETLADKAIRARFAGNAAVRRHSFSLEVMVDQTLAVYREVLS
ncbi:glycosyltransferase [Rhizobium sp. S153]|uniref:Glycosyltransferase n=1 Tax=Ciceribacter sichuanensis TaxID=2949647 RepID=A0ABT0V2F8_9HYPH|nr:glycosyltransferase [Ciceribacter sp. S153]MCM2400064.1 glycosyltransferase [Ciceribacter sp. S153]